MSGAAGNALDRPLRAHVDALPKAWRDALAPTFASPGFAALEAYVDGRRANGAVVYPAQPFRALDLATPHDTRVLIVGQDPYHGPGQAQGLAFSVPTGFKRPPSLRNIFNELAREFGGDPKSFDNDLGRWADQGVLLLNTSLTVEDGQAASHARRGWERVTDDIIECVARDPAPKVFMLWGGHAQQKQALLAGTSQHLVLMANHPSPLSASRPPVPFIGCGHFKTANDWLVAQGRQPIDWV